MSKSALIPAEAKRKSDNKVALGEVTGHYHEVVGQGVAVYENGEKMFVDVPTEAVISHQEHNTIELPGNVYERQIVREYDHFTEEARAVVD